VDVLATGLPYLTEACLTPFAAVQYADGPFARSGAETEQASRDKWRELLLLLARPIGESHVVTPRRICRYDTISKNYGGARISHACTVGGVGVRAHLWSLSLFDEVLISDQC
jgi:hypothetical protein